MNSPEMKLAKVPESSVLHFGVDTVKGETFKFPLISVKNVFIFPGKLHAMIVLFCRLALCLNILW